MSIVNLDLYRGIQSIAKPLKPAVAYTPPVPVTESVATQPASKEELDKAVRHLNQYISTAVSSIEFSVDEDSGRTLVKVVDTETGKVLRQIPNAEVLALSKTLDRVEGLLIKHTA